MFIYCYHHRRNYETDAVTISIKISLSAQIKEMNMKLEHQKFADNEFKNWEEKKKLLYNARYDRSQPTNLSIIFKSSNKFVCKIKLEIKKKKNVHECVWY